MIMGGGYALKHMIMFRKRDEGIFFVGWDSIALLQNKIGVFDEMMN